MGDKYRCEKKYRNCKKPYIDKEDQFISWLNINNRGIGNSRGIRSYNYLNKKIYFDNLNMPASVIIVHTKVKTINKNPWENTIFEDRIEYCGDCKESGKDPDLSSGNKVLNNILQNMNKNNLDLIPPILYFYQEKSGEVQFKGLYFIDSKSIYESNLEDGKILNNYKYILRKIKLEEVEVDWIRSRALAQNKYEINNKAPKEWIEGLKNYFNQPKQENLYKENQLIAPLINDEEFYMEYNEGTRTLKQHYKRERESKVIKLAKEKFKKENERLYCEICGFDFEEVYGELGLDFIEGHHTIPVSEMEENQNTKPQDIIMVCSNCHRMLHRKSPCLDSRELKKIIKIKK